MEEVAINRETYQKVVNVLAQMPYVQVAQLLAELGENTRDIEQEDKDVEGDGN